MAEPTPRQVAWVDQLAASLREYKLARKRLDRACAEAARNLAQVADAIRDMDELEQLEFIQAKAAFEQS